MPCMSSKLLVAGVRQRFHDIFLCASLVLAPGKGLTSPKFKTLIPKKDVFLTRSYTTIRWLR